ncbi:hypothetical protein [Azospirillum sp. SYSU D00513]|uniref:hypothetical protein n=1 Tax=Azospirillum sp. SYSU D00513 TaxID=2812561 RepID=UPI001A963E0A|nr:hypothetical protein [Azospirillum sp. SYSU D00513]
MLEALAARLQSALSLPVFVGFKPPSHGRCVVLRALPTAIDAELPGLHRLDFVVTAFSDDLADALQTAGATSAAINLLGAPLAEWWVLHCRPLTLPVPNNPAPGVTTAEFRATARWRLA